MTGSGSGLSPALRRALLVVPWTRDLPAFLDDKLGFLTARAALGGPPPKLALGWPTRLLTDPADIEHVLIGNHRAYDKARRLTGRQGQRMVGDALLTRRGPDHRERRRALQPLFHRRPVAELVPLSAEVAAREVAAWPPDRPFDASAGVHRLMLEMRLRTTFSDASEVEIDRLSDAVVAHRRFLLRRFAPLRPLAELFPRALARQNRVALRVLHDAIDVRVECARQDTRPRDLVSLMLEARENGNRLSRRDVRNEIVTLILPGYETPAAMILWVLHLLSRHPVEQERVSDEIASALEGRVPEVADVERLPYLRSVIAETLRLYPVTWITPRVATKDDVLPSGLRVRRHGKLYLSQWVTHRDPRLHADPERFDPGRFAAGWRGSMPRGVYFPFGGGPHVCIGERIATAEGMLILANVLGRWRVEPVDDRPVVPAPGVAALRPRGGLVLRLRARAASERTAA